MEVVKAYLNGEGGYTYLAEKFVKGRPPNMKHKEENNVEKADAKVCESERVKELENQVRHLQIENAYLKELRRLRLEETRKQKK